MVESALTLPLLLMVAIALVQLAIFEHAQTVVTASVQDGARVAAADGRSVSDGVAYAQTLLQAGLGQDASQVTLQGTDGGEVVAIQAQGQLHMVFPWVADATLPLSARSVVSKEEFRVRATS